MIVRVHEQPFVDEHGFDPAKMDGSFGEDFHAESAYDRPRLNEHLFEGQEPHRLLGNAQNKALYERKLIEGINKLDPPGGGGVSFGTAPSPGNFDSNDWARERDLDFGNRFTPSRAYHMLVLISNDGPSRALKRIVDNPQDWRMDCAYFVQVAHLHALSQVNPSVFDDHFRGKRFLLRYHHSSGISENFSFDRERKQHPWFAWYRKTRSAPRRKHRIKNTSKWTTNSIKAAMPIGSRLMWRHDLIQLSDRDAFRNENAVKVGPNQYKAFPLQPPGSAVRHLTENQIRLQLARHGMDTYPDRHDPNLSPAEVAQRHVFLSEAQRFYTP
jgi:hypothetical protein